MDLAKYVQLPVGYPVRHRRKVPFHPRLTASAAFQAAAREIQRLDFELDRFILSKDDYFTLVQEASASNIHFSTKLEGNPLTLQQVKRLTRDSLGKGTHEKRPTTPAQEILNHLAIWLSPDTIRSDWDPAFVRATHRTLMRGINPAANPGRYRDTEMSVYTDQGQETFIACPAKFVQEELSSLMEWKRVSAPAMHPVAAAAVFYHEFESIHPFADGNGRVGRTLFHWYLQLHGLPNAHLCMVEQELMKDPEVYYRVLGYTDQSGSYEALLDFFAEALLESYQASVDRLERKDLLSSDMPETSKRLLVAAKAHGWFSIQDAAHWVTGVGDQTVRKRLNDLVDQGLLVAAGRTQAKRYRYVHPLEEVRQAVAELYGSLLEPGESPSA